MGAKTKIDWCGIEWLPVPEYDGYFASTDGRILSMKSGRPRELSQISAKDEHKYVFMYKKGKMKKVWVHRAVLSAYDGTDMPDKICRHLDDNPNNNTVENLCWGTYSDNAQDRRSNRGYLCGEDAPGAKLVSKQVMEIRCKYANGARAQNLAQEYGVQRNTILEIVRGETWANQPLIPVMVKHISKRLTPLSEEHIAKFVEGGIKYAESRKKQRIMIECDCGCGELIETPDNKGRQRRFKRGHNNRGMRWRWKNGN